MGSVLYIYSCVDMIDTVYHLEQDVQHSLLSKHLRTIFSMCVCLPTHICVHICMALYYTGKFIL